MENTISSWLPHSGFRSPAWRWLRACHLNEHRRRLDPRLDDDGVKRALHFLRAEQRSDRRPHQRRSDHALRTALDLWRTDAPRWQVEGYLLTDEPLTAVARHCGLPLDVVDAYAHLFFACRESKNSTDWLQLRAVGGGPWNYFANGRLDVLWKHFALTSGPRALELVMAVTLDEPLPAWACPRNRHNARYTEAHLRTACKLLIAAMTARSDAEFKGLVEVWERMQKLDAQASGLRSERSGLLPVMQDFLKMAGGSPKRRGKTAGATQASRDQADDRGSGKRPRQHLSLTALLDGLK